jgi:hypothetical protein
MIANHKIQPFDPMKNLIGQRLMPNNKIYPNRRPVMRPQQSLPRPIVVVGKQLKPM